MTTEHFIVAAAIFVLGLFAGVLLCAAAIDKDGKPDRSEIVAYLMAKGQWEAIRNDLKRQ